MDESKIRKLGPMSQEEAEIYGTQTFGNHAATPKESQEHLDYWSGRARSALILLIDNEDHRIRFVMWGTDEDQKQMADFLNNWMESGPDQSIKRRLMDGE